MQNIDKTCACVTVHGVEVSYLVKSTDSDLAHTFGLTFTTSFSESCDPTFSPSPAFLCRPDSSIFFNIRLSRNATAHHGTSDRNAQRVPERNASRTRVCAAAGSAPMPALESSPAELARAMASASAGETAPVLMRWAMLEVTLPLSTAPHWASPTVPPKERNYTIENEWK